MSALAITAFNPNWKTACRFGHECDMRRDPDHEQAWEHLNLNAKQGPKMLCPFDKDCYMTLDALHLSMFHHSVVLPSEEDVRAAEERRAAEAKAEQDRLAAEAAKKAAQELDDPDPSLEWGDAVSIGGSNSRKQSPPREGKRQQANGGAPDKGDAKRPQQQTPPAKQKRECPNGDACMEQRDARHCDEYSHKLPSQPAEPVNKTKQLPPCPNGPNCEHRNNAKHAAQNSHEPVKRSPCPNGADCQHRDDAKHAAQCSHPPKQPVEFQGECKYGANCRMLDQSHKNHKTHCSLWAHPKTAAAGAGAGGKSAASSAAGGKQAANGAKANQGQQAAPKPSPVPVVKQVCPLGPDCPLIKAERGHTDQFVHPPWCPLYAANKRRCQLHAAKDAQHCMAFSHPQDTLAGAATAKRRVELKGKDRPGCPEMMDCLLLAMDDDHKAKYRHLCPQQQKGGLCRLLRDDDAKHWDQFMHKCPQPAPCALLMDASHMRDYFHPQESEEETPNEKGDRADAGDSKSESGASSSKRGSKKPSEDDEKSPSNGANGANGAKKPPTHIGVCKYGKKDCRMYKDVNHKDHDTHCERWAHP